MRIAEISHVRIPEECSLARERVRGVSPFTATGISFHVSGDSCPTFLCSIRHNRAFQDNRTRGTRIVLRCRLLELCIYEGRHHVISQLVCDLSLIPRSSLCGNPEMNYSLTDSLHALSKSRVSRLWEPSRASQHSLQNHPQVVGALLLSKSKRTIREVSLLFRIAHGRDGSFL